MTASFYELRHKQVINVVNGEYLGHICDVDIELDCAQVTALIVPGRSKFFGLFGKEPDLCIPWSEISVIGRDTILVTRTVPQEEPPRKKKWL
ncbi:MAG: YlmC/YmxH family sporulation protein [Clostridia bacterium]|nr:YlmC/YmxH family sporulation protein [Clostridia bacterium]